MLTYKAVYIYLDDGIHGQILDFPGVITCGSTLEETRRLLASALVDRRKRTFCMANHCPSLTDPEADLEEPMHLLLTAASRVNLTPQDATW